MGPPTREQSQEQSNQFSASISSYRDDSSTKQSMGPPTQTQDAVNVAAFKATIAPYKSSAPDASITGSEPASTGASMTPAEQSLAYAQGRDAAGIATGTGIGATGYSFWGNAGTGTALQNIFTPITKFFGAVLGLSNPSPIGKAQGALGISGLFTGNSGAQMADGWANLSRNWGMAGSPAPAAIASAPGATQTAQEFSNAYGFTTTSTTGRNGDREASPVIGWGGAIANTSTTAAASKPTAAGFSSAAGYIGAGSKPAPTTRTGMQADTTTTSAPILSIGAVLAVLALLN